MYICASKAHFELDEIEACYMNVKSFYDKRKLWQFSFVHGNFALNISPDCQRVCFYTINVKHVSLLYSLDTFFMSGTYISISFRM